MKYFLLVSCLLFTLFSCKNTRKNKFAFSEENKTTISNGNTIKTRFQVPKGFKRIHTSEKSFANYLQNFKLKPVNSKVYLYNDALKSRQDLHEAVLNIDVGNRDLQQCADAIMRLRAEYLYQHKRYTDIHFNFTNGFRVDYYKWRKGYRLKVTGNKVRWYKTEKESTSYKSFTHYLQWIFMYAGTLSLEKELSKVTVKNMKIGDIFIQGGNPGHAIIVVDMAKNSINERIFMLAQSYMPAQEIHVLKNLNNNQFSPWYRLTNLKTLESPEWMFSSKNLKRF